MIGTPLYMSPQAEMTSLDIDTRSDIYALGVLLYELLTATHPSSRTRSPASAWMKSGASSRWTRRGFGIRRRRRN
jgi:serine/threonine protein kinase